MPFRGPRRRPQAMPGSGHGPGHPAMARPRDGRGPRWAAPALGWVAVLGLLVFVAIIVGRPGRDAGTAAATGSPGPTLLPVAFGTAIDHDSGEAADLTTRFRAGEPFAYSVHLPTAVGQTTVYVEVLRVTAEGLVQVQAPQAQKTLPDRPVIAYLVTTDGLIEAFGTGDFVLRVYLDPTGDPLAAGAFTVVPPAA
jgi:hypothetical protein